MSSWLKAIGIILVIAMPFIFLRRAGLLKFLPLIFLLLIPVLVYTREDRFLSLDYKFFYLSLLGLIIITIYELAKSKK